MIQLPTPLIEDVSKIVITPARVGEVIMSNLTNAKTARANAEKVWEQCYRLWRNSSIDKEALRQDAQTEANTSVNWRHKVNTGKTFEVVETLTAYLKSATFPSDDWFKVWPKDANLGEAVQVLQELIKYEMLEADVTDNLEQYCRQLVLFGFATYKVYYSSEIKRKHYRNFNTSTATYKDSVRNEDCSSIKIEVPSPFDIWVDAWCKSTWARLNLSREEFLGLIYDEYVTVGEITAATYEPTHSNPTSGSKIQPTNSKNSPEIIEFYGSVTIEDVCFPNVHAMFLGKELIRLCDSEYWCGSPYISMALLPDLESVYGISPLHPNLGILHTDNVLTNLRLDNLLIHMQGIWEKVQDGILDDEDMVLVPGKIYKVSNRGNLSRIDMGPANFAVGYQEQAVLHASIDRNMATGPLIGAGQPRRGDRVTAEEILAVRDAGGNRINAIHTRVESKSTLPLLKHAFQLLQQYQIEEVVLRVFNQEANDYEFLVVPPEVFTMPIELEPIGANYVIETSRNLSSLMQLVDISSRNPEMSAMIDYKEVMLEAMKQMRLHNPKRFLKTEKPSAPAIPAPSPEPSLGGDVVQMAAQQQLAEDGGAEMLNALGVPTEGVPLEILQGAMTNANGFNQPDAAS